MITKEELERVESIRQECDPKRKPWPLRIYPDDAQFLIEMIHKLMKEILVDGAK